jgi:hypothetical protein
MTLHNLAKCLYCGCALLLTGCAQTTDQGARQVTQQETDTPTSTAQDTATQGSYVNVYVMNDSGGGGLPNASLLKVGPEDGIQALMHDLKNRSGTELAETNAGKVIAGVEINVTTGGTTPTVTGSATGTGTATQSPAQDQQQTPTQDIRPELSTSLNAAFAPGGMIDQLAAAVGRGTLSELTKQNQQDLRAAYAQGLQSGDFGAFFEQFSRIFGVEMPAAAPMAPPVDAE